MARRPPGADATGLASAGRRGVILLVVLMLLTLFAVVALAFVLTANAAATAARIAREAEIEDRADADPELLLAHFLGQLIYDAPDDVSGVYSALRGHSLARNMYGLSGSSGPVVRKQPVADLVAFNGTGRLHAPSPFGPVVPGLTVNDYDLLNYTHYRDDPQLPVDQRFLRDPERPGWRRSDPAAPRRAFAGGFNVPYTYPDMHATFLAAVRADGSVLLPSFHRPWAGVAPGSGLPANAGEFYDRDTNQLNPLWSGNPPPLPPWYKYTTLRPLPALNPGFPLPEDGGGDVKNLAGSPGTLRRQTGSTPEYWNNDSYWIDLDFPVLQTPGGRKYKPLFAPLVVDLDGRVNVNVHGNAQGARGAHHSNQGWGDWEVSLRQVLPRGNEWQGLLRGTATPPQTGKYGASPGAVPGVLGASAPPGRPQHFFSETDFDGFNERTNAPSGALLLPGSGAAATSCFPSYLTARGGYAGYGNRAAAERRNHPSLYDSFQPAGQNRAFPIGNMEALLRYGDTNSPALTSDLFRLCPVNLTEQRLRGLLTTHSFDLGRPGVAPWIFDPAAYPYELEATLDPDQPGQPKGPPIAPPAPNRLNLPPADIRTAHGEYGPVDWRAVSARLGRLDLHRPLPPYPHMGSGATPPFGPPLTVRGGQPVLDIPFDVDAPTGPIWRQFLLAQAARQQLANDIYRRLLVVTGVSPILPEQNPQAPPPVLLRVRRWLAQLAANIVDFLDEDDVCTPFCFYTAEDYAQLAAPPVLPPDPDRVSRPDAALLTGRPDAELQWPTYWVFGSEMPRVLVTEAMAQAARNDPDQAYADSVRVFAELANPFPDTLPANLLQQDRLPVPLRMTGRGSAYSPYRLVIGVNAPVPFRVPGAAILPGVDNDNVLGCPEPAVIRQATTDDDFATMTVAPPRGSGAGVVLIGPSANPAAPWAAYDAFAAGIPPATPTLRSPNLEYARTFAIRQPGDPPDERSEGVSVMLRRLANPYLSHDPRRRLPGAAAPHLTYNPYVTTDYLEDVPLQGVTGGGALASTGKLQPYAAHRSQLRQQTAAAQPTLLHTFGRDNGPAPEHYDWLTHLDRAPISPLELLHVSAYQPYQLTQRFMTTDAQGGFIAFGHRAPWLDDGQAPGGPSYRLYRLFEFLDTASESAGVAAGGRQPGKINLNTVWDPEILQALCDPQPANAFTAADVNSLFARFVYDGSQSVYGPWRRTQQLTPGPDDKPFQGYAAGSYPPGSDRVSLRGVEDTLLRLQTGVEGAHPYLATQLLTKIAGRVTSRSNVFAVWLTVGFFEVTDDSVRPARLGAELGRADGRHIRHRMFAILDRSNLSIASCVSSLLRPTPPQYPYPIPLIPWTVPVNALSGVISLPGTSAGIPWKIEAGTMLVVDAGANQETAEVLAVTPPGPGTPPTIKAVFAKAHPANTALSLAHVPGAPPVFLKPLSVAPIAGRADLTVRIAVDGAASSAAVLTGRYENVSWTIAPGSRLIIDEGASQEIVTVASAGFRFDPATASGSFRIAVTKPHADSFSISNTFLGNAGPQARFNPRDPAYSAVVRYLSIIQ